MTADDPKARNSQRHSGVLSSRPETYFNIKISSYQYRNSHCRDKTILRPSYLHNGISYTGMMISLYWISAAFQYNDGLSMYMDFYHKHKTVLRLSYLFSWEPYNKGGIFNSSPPTATFTRQWIRSALDQIMACRLFGAKPLSKPSQRWSPCVNNDFRSNEIILTRFVGHLNCAVWYTKLLSLSFAHWPWEMWNVDTERWNFRPQILPTIKQISGTIFVYVNFGIRVWWFNPSPGI